VSNGPTACASCGGQNLNRRYALRPFDVYECGTCGLRARHPLPTPSELTAMYEADAYHASAYFQDGRTAGHGDGPEIAIYRRGLDDLARIVPPGRLLDVGCGNGVFLDLAREAGWQGSGVELSTRHVATAAERYALEVWHGDLLQAPFDNGSFNAIAMWDLLEHVVDPVAVLRRARQLLAPGGALLVFTIDTTSLFNLVGDLLYRASGRRAVRAIELLYDGRHNYFFTRNSLHRLLDGSGFMVKQWRGDRAYLGRWLAEPAPWYLVAGGMVLDRLSFALQRPYRQTAICQVDGAP